MALYYYSDASGMMWIGAPTRVVANLCGNVFAYFANPIEPKGSHCIIEVWKKTSKKFLWFTYKRKVQVISVFRVRLKGL